MILVTVNENGERYECYGKTIEQLRDVQERIRESKGALCPECLAPMQIRIYETGIRTNHFFHLSDEGCGWGSGESEEHLFAKTAMRKYLEKRDLWNGCRFDFEHRIEVNGNVKVIDLAVFHPDGRKEAHEAQLSKQTITEFEKRTADYRAAGFETVWWLGANNEMARDWCYAQLGWVGSIEVTDVPLEFGDETYKMPGGAK